MQRGSCTSARSCVQLSRIGLERCRAMVTRNADGREEHSWAVLRTWGFCSKKYTLWAQYSSVTLNRVAQAVSQSFSSRCVRLTCPSLYAAFMRLFPVLFQTAIIMILYLASSFFPFYLLLISLCSIFLQCLLLALRFSFIPSLSLLPITVLTFVLVSSGSLEGAAVTYTCWLRRLPWTLTMDCAVESRLSPVCDRPVAVVSLGWSAVVLRSRDASTVPSG